MEPGFELRIESVHTSTQVSFSGQPRRLASATAAWPIWVPSKRNDVWNIGVGFGTGMANWSMNGMQAFWYFEATAGYRSPTTRPEMMTSGLTWVMVLAASSGLVLLG